MTSPEPVEAGPPSGNVTTRGSEWVFDEWALSLYEHTLEGIARFSPGERSAAAELASAALEMVRAERERRHTLVGASDPDSSRIPEEISAYERGWRDAMAQENAPERSTDDRR